MIALAAASAAALTVLGVAAIPTATRAADAPREAVVGGPFTLVDQDGRTVTDRDFRGKWLLVYFGYTHCPDACPTALSNVAGALDELEPSRRDKVETLFITVDPERDTVPVMREYAKAFPGANLVGLTGTQAQVEAAEKVFRVFAKKRDVPDEPGEYSMDHSSVIYLLDPQQRVAAYFLHMTPPEVMTKKLKELVK